MIPYKNSRRNLCCFFIKGSLLIELLITIVLISVALLGAANIHASIINTRNIAKQRLLALKLLSKKIEDLKQFEVIKTTTGKIAYQDIGNNTGGAIASGTYQDFTLIWCVDTNDCKGNAFHGNYYYHGYNSVPTIVVRVGAIVPDFKKIKVLVSWKDKNNIEKTILNETIINPKKITNSGIVTNANIKLY